jgi:hypothetical protein
LLANEDRAHLRRAFAKHDLRPAIGDRAEPTNLRFAQKRLTRIGGRLRLSGLGEAGGDSNGPASIFDGRAETMLASRCRAADDIAGIKSVSGRFAQYFFGISFSMARSTSRAGLKIER